MTINLNHFPGISFLLLYRKPWTHHTFILKTVNLWNQFSHVSFQRLITSSWKREIPAQDELNSNSLKYSPSFETISFSHSFIGTDFKVNLRYLKLPANCFQYSIVISSHIWCLTSEGVIQIYLPLYLQNMAVNAVWWSPNTNPSLKNEDMRQPRLLKRLCLGSEIYSNRGL